MAIGAIGSSAVGGGSLAGERQGTVVAQENAKNNTMKAGISSQPVSAAQNGEKEKSIVEQENAKNNTMQAGIDNQDLNDVKGVQSVDVKG